MRTPRRPDPEVLEIDYRIPTALGTVGWTVALIVLLAMGDDLAEADRWWLWVCLAGIALGVFGFLYIPRLLRKRGAAEQAQADGYRESAPPTQAPDEPDHSAPRY